MMEWRSAEKRQLLKAINDDVGSLCSVLAETIPYGVAYHNSTLTMDERQHIESAYMCGVLFSDIRTKMIIYLRIYAPAYLPI